jgi:hypothetical protein
MDSILAFVHMKVEQWGTAITRFNAMGWCDICKLMSQIARTTETQRGERETVLQQNVFAAERHVTDRQD